MRRLTSCALLCLILAAASSCCRAQQLLVNNSFETGTTSWTINYSYSVSVVTSYAGVTPADGVRMLALAGPANVGYTYPSIVSQSRSAPFGTGIPTDNFLVYLYASTYLHTTDGRNVSYAVTIEPGYGQVAGLFHGGPQNAWVTSQSSGYYIAHDPLDASAPAKPITVSLELRDPLGPGEYLLLDDVELIYGGAGIPEPSALAALLAGLGLFAVGTRLRRRLPSIPYSLFPIPFLLLAVCAAALAGVTRHDVLVIANANSPQSVAVANYYAAKRNIPASHVRTVTCTTSETIDPAGFAALRDQIKSHLLSLGSSPDSPATDPISAIVLCTGIPHKVNDSSECSGALDTALAACFSESTWEGAARRLRPLPARARFPESLLRRRHVIQVVSGRRRRVNHLGGVSRSGIHAGPNARC